MFHHFFLKHAAVLVLIASFAGPLAAQTNAFVQIRVDDEVITLGETTFFPTGEDFVEITSYSLGLENAVSSTGGLPTSRLAIRPIEFTKPITPSSVLLRRALAEGRIVTAEVRIYDLSAAPTEIYRVNAVNALLTNISPYYGDPNTGNAFYESVALLPSAITFLHVPSGTVYDLQANASP